MWNSLEQCGQGMYDDMWDLDGYTVCKSYDSLEGVEQSGKGAGHQLDDELGRWCRDGKMVGTLADGIESKWVCSSLSGYYF
jgi:hypothetical protein